jgi:hypothetical protein
MPVVTYIMQPTWTQTNVPTSAAWSVSATTQVYFNVDANSSYYYYVTTMSTNPPQPLFPESFSEQVQRQADERTQRRRQAEARARALLLSLLTEDARATFADTGVIHVVGSAGGRYRIERGYSGNIHGGGREYCAHPRMTSPEGDRMPMEDAMIAQMLMIQTDEPGFLEIANAS